MDWTAGYASDIEYTAGFYREQAPFNLNFACVLNGIEPVDTSKPFTYFELGFGRGLTATVLAATAAHGRFYAADFNPAHVAGARQMAQEAKLDNLTLLENSFEELAEGQVADLPQFDFITLHGIYTWVTAENRRHIVKFIRRYLKPGGIVYLGYNAMPGWSVSLPLQRLIVEYADLHPNRSDVQVKAATDFIDKLDQAKAGYFEVAPALRQRLDTLKTANPNYLVHEYMHKHWQPMYFADVVRDLAEAKLDYAGSAEASSNFTALFLNEEKQAVINANPDPIFRQTVKDYFLNTAFRKDVFVRGARRMSQVRQTEWLLACGVALTVPRDEATLSLKLPEGNVNAKPEVYNPVLDALADGPKTIRELRSLPGLQQVPVPSLAQVVALLTSSGQANIFFGAADHKSVDSAAQMNRVLGSKARYGDEFQTLASPLLGSGVGAGLIDRLLFDALEHNVNPEDTAALAEHIWAILGSQGRQMLKDGKALTTAEENLSDIRDRVDTIVRTRLPLWRQLGIRR
ncbi:class I SAM-dependent methyltransferase [Massilia cavernae]|uniref:Methyltransferase domain-containing protein n=1 Tax=Massilia cavernae TaxID=2320864 RepID=A0A418XGY6_9BURK|nr:class I SAM-dependent methyltransferase [Massilia cavernae]RJG11732.1 methyltransferase domain-containing protein [Massilia cavernae]